MTPRQRLRQQVDRGATVWFAGAQDALSALLVDQSPFDGVFTTGFGIAASLLGRPDMELYTLTENVGVVSRICDVVAKPVFADADTGYGNVLNVQRTVRAFEKAGAAAISIEDQLSPKRCPAAGTPLVTISIADAVAKIRAAVDARQDPDFLIVARTDAIDPGEATERAVRYAEAGADLIQPISRTFSSAEELARLHAACGRRLSLQLMEGTWTARLERSQIEAVAAFASYPLVSLMSTVQAVQTNLAALAARCGQPIDDLPMPRAEMAGFKRLIGWHALEAQQARYELPQEPPA